MSQQKNKSDGLENAVMGIGKIFLLVFKICRYGVKRINFKSFDMWTTFFMVATLLAALLFGNFNWLQGSFGYIWGDPLPFYFRLFFYMSEASQYATLMTLFVVGALVALGFKEFRKYAVFQRAMDRTGLRAATGEKPKVTAILPTGENRSKVVVETFGVGLSKFEAQKDSLTTGFKQTVESIKLANDKAKVEIHLCERDLPKMVGFHELYVHVKEPYSFIIGQSLKGPLVQPIRSLPHLLISELYQI